MGAIHIDATIHNPADREKCWQGRFLVDTGATDSVVPKRHLHAIGLQPEDTRLYELADGREVELGIAGVRIELMDTFTAGLAVFGEDDAEPILGVTGAGIHRRRDRPAQSALEAAAGRAIEVA